MFAARWILAATAAVCVCINADAQFRDAPRAEVRGLVKSIDVKAGTITLAAEGRDATGEKTLTLAKDVEVAIGSPFGRGIFKEGKLTDLTAGIRISATLSADQKTVDSIAAEGPTVRGIIKSVDGAKKTITVAQQMGREPAAEERTYEVPADAEVAIDDGRGKRFSIKEAQIGDLKEGSMVTVRLSLDQKQVQSVIAEGPNLNGTIKSIDAGKNTVTLVMRPQRGDDAAEEKTLTLAKEAVVWVDDGRGRRLSQKEVKLGDIPVGSMANARLTVDQNTITMLRAEGPMLFGMLKAVDADKGTLVLAIPRGRGDDPEEKTLTLSKDARVILDGAEAKLGQLKPGEEGQFLQVRLSLDQKTAQLVMVGQRRR